VRRYDFEAFEDEFLKDLKKVKRAGHRLERVLVVDDTLGNAVYVPPFLGDPADEVLPRLARYLVSLRDVPDVRAVEKPGWLRNET
jgi:hypothetical protein